MTGRKGRLVRGAAGGVAYEARNASGVDAGAYHRAGWCVASTPAARGSSPTPSWNSCAEAPSFDRLHCRLCLPMAAAPHLATPQAPRWS